MKNQPSLSKDFLSRLPVAGRYLSRHAQVEFACPDYAAPVPEPGTLLFLGSGLLGLGLLRRRKS